MSALSPWILSLLALVLCLLAVTVFLHRHQQRLQQDLQESQVQQQRMQSFMAAMSHHLRTPLNGIMGYAEYIRSSSQEPMIHFTSRIILENSVDMLHMVNDLLDIHKIQTGQLQLFESEFDVYELLTAVQELHQPHAARRQLSLQISTNQQAPLKVKTDQYRLRQVLNHLVDNAITYNRPQGEVTLQLWHDMETKRLTFTVADTGPGLDAEVQTQLQSALSAMPSDFPSTHQQGAGLGLALSHQLLRLMGSKLDYRTEPGAGCRFFFTLPLRAMSP
jgi:signal transduction histidine kinase